MDTQSSDTTQTAATQAYELTAEQARDAAARHAAFATAAAPPEKPAPAADPLMAYVLDTTATPTNKVRTHELLIDGMIKSFSFEHDKPKHLAQHLAIRFLKHEGFVLTDKDGNRLDFKRRPKQPDELGAGERLKLKDDEVVARYDELATNSLYARASELPGGEKFSVQGRAVNRSEMITFIRETKKKMAEANKSKEADHDADGFTPEGGVDDEFDVAS